MIFRGVTYCQCMDCGACRIFYRFRDARASGWALGRESGSSRLVYSWCPNCASAHRRGRPKRRFSDS